MKSIWKVALGCLVFASLATANAYTVFTINDRGSSWQETDVFVIGYAGGVGNQFVAVAATRAYKILERYPDRKMVFMYAMDSSQARDRQTASQVAGAKITVSNSSSLTMDIVVRELAKHSRITSLHFSGHSSALYGFGLQKGQRFTPDRNKLIGLKRNFTDGAYIYLHGCNTGFTSATGLSEIWELPVFGSLTSTDFQQLHADGEWYWNNKGQYPDRGGWRRANNLSFEAPKSCQTLACHRLKANNHPYTGGWGKYETGLPFFKAFCRFPLNNSRSYQRCTSGIWEAILTWPSTQNLSRRGFSRSEYIGVVKDYLCPKIDGYSVDRGCSQVLDQSLNSGSVSSSKFFWGNQPSCSFSGCDVYQTSGRSNLGGSRTTLFTSRDAGNSALVQEFRMYLELYDRFAR